ncbi:MAG: PAS domain-containing sensor histidine kinase [Kiloniellales bacterium]|nr:PAS domain-containing sensor histidine kinase [Kiloniellales bacterium]
MTAQVEVTECAKGEPPEKGMQKGSRAASLPQALSPRGGRQAASETRSRDCLRASVDWQWETDRDLNYVNVSNGILRVLGTPPDLLCGQPLASICADAEEELVSRLNRRKPFRGLVLPLVSGDGRRISLSGVPAFDAAGAFAGYRGTGCELQRDIGDPERIAELDRAIGEIADLGQLWHWEADQALRLTALSDGYTQITGRRREDTLGSDFAEAWGLDEAAKIAVRAREELRDAAVDWRHEVEGRRRFLISGRPLFSADGGFNGYRGIGRDVTDLLRNEEWALSARAEAEQASRAKSAFLADMSHELRTSLNAILGFSDAMRSGVLGTEDTERYRAYANDIHESGQHLLDLVNAMLDLSRIEAGKEDLSCEPVDMAQLIESCCRMLKPEIDKRRLRLELDAARDAPELHVDPPKMRQIVLNLLGNAVKFTPQGGRVFVGFRIAESGAAELEVRDSGVGIKSSEIPKILSRFGQARSGPGTEGTGLGLAITKSLAELHGGVLVVESNEGAGARFLVRLPEERVLGGEPGRQEEPWRILF